MSKEIREMIDKVKNFKQFVNENTDNKIAVLIDGTSSAGKSMTTKLLNAVPFYEAKDPNQWVQIDSDMFQGFNNEEEERRLKLDHPNIRDWARGNDAGMTSGIYRKSGVEGIPENPYETEKPYKGGDIRAWYMAEAYLRGPWKKVIFDSISNDVLKYVPNAKNILLHAPISILMKNIDERNARGVEPRKHEGVLKQYLNKYEATKNVPDEEVGHSVPVTKKDLEDKLLSSGVSEEFTKEFFNKLGMDSNGKYYIKIRDKYLKPGVQLINVDSKRTEYLNNFKSIIDGFK
jgi:hypothetical protein